MCDNLFGPLDGKTKMNYYSQILGHIFYYYYQAQPKFIYFIITHTSIQYILNYISQMKRFTILALLLALALSITLSPPQVKILPSSNQHSTLPSALPAKIFAGQIHYSRIPVQYWQHRILMVKALGLNALSVYVMWNYHEISKGKFDYSTENKNLSKFLELAEKHEMKVLLRPGPYVCAEWDFGGLPARLLNIKNLVIRSNNIAFLEQVRIYFESLTGIIKKHLETSSNPKGSIILLQIQNEYGFYGTDKSYIESLRKIWLDLKVECEQYYVDWVENIQKCHWTGSNIGINNAISEVQFDYVKTFEKKGYLLGGEIYSGWLTHWGEKWQSKSIEKNQQEYGFLMANNHSYSMYMVHGGTNFGLTAGANAVSGERYDYGGHVTSYDYDAPINQQGSSTQKYESLKSLIKKYATWQIPSQPTPIPQIQIPRTTLTACGSLLDSLPKAAIQNSKEYYVFESDQLEMYNQGIVVYETNLTKRKYYFETLVHDYAIIFIDGVFVKSLDRSDSMIGVFQVECFKERCLLRVVVEAMGHVNFDHQMEEDYKGIIDITDDLATTFIWNMYKIPIEKNILEWNKYSPSTNMSPTLLKSTFTLSQTGDVYLDTRQLTKGYLWVNGRNLGRYWWKGPQQRLFCPGVWLKTGENTIHVLDLHFDGKQKGITGKKTLQLPSYEQNILAQ